MYYWKYRVDYLLNMVINALIFEIIVDQIPSLKLTESCNCSPEYVKKNNSSHVDHNIYHFETKNIPVPIISLLYAYTQIARRNTISLRKKTVRSVIVLEKF